MCKLGILIIFSLSHSYIRFCFSECETEFKTILLMTYISDYRIKDFLFCYHHCAFIHWQWSWWVQVKYMQNIFIHKIAISQNLWIMVHVKNVKMWDCNFFVCEKSPIAICIYANFFSSIFWANSNWKNFRDSGCTFYWWKTSRKNNGENHSLS